MFDPTLRDQLLALNSETPTLREKYEKEKQKMLEKTLNVWQRTAFILSGVLGLVFFVGFGIVLFSLPSELPLIARACFVVGSVFGLVWSVMCYRIVTSGKMNLRKDPAIMIGGVWIVVVFTMTADLMIGMEMKDPAQGARLILFGLVFLIMGALFMIQRMIEQSELNVKENMLRIELQMAELRERLEGNTTP